MEARRRGYRQQGRRPQNERHPLANLTRSMSQPATEPASAPVAAPHPAPLPRSRADHRRHLPARRTRPGAGQLGPERHLDGGDLQPGAVVAPLTVTLGARLRLRRRRGDLAASPVHAPQPASGQRTRCGRRGERQAAPPGRLLLRRRVRALPRRPALAAGPGAVALRHLRPARAHAIQRAPPPSPTCSTFTFWNVHYSSKYLDPESVERYSSLNPTGAALSRPAAPDAAPGGGHQGLRASAPTRSRSLDVANRYVLNGAASPRRCWRGSHRARSRAT